jgi:hypothetical protein
MSVGRRAAHRQFASTPEDGDPHPEPIACSVGATESTLVGSTNASSGSSDHDVELIAVFRPFDKMVPGCDAELGEIGGSGRIRGNHSQLCTRAHGSQLLVGTQHGQWAKQPAGIQFESDVIRHSATPPAIWVSSLRYARIARKPN